VIDADDLGVRLIHEQFFSSGGERGGLSAIGSRGR